MSEIERLIKKLNISRIGFKKLVKNWTKDKIVYNFIPLLHLEQKEKITTEQEEMFKELFVRKKEIVKTS